jgi:hypothetical protein
MADRSYGIQSPTAASGGAVYQGNLGQPDYGSYVRNNADLMDAYNASGGQYGGIEDFGSTHYQTHGRGEGRELRMFEAPQQMAQMGQTEQASGQPFDPLADFNASADAKLLNYAPISNNINAMYSAKGAGLDGSAIKALQDRTTNYTQNAFYNWRGGLEGSPTGANASNQQAGQNMVNQNAGYRSNNVNALASSYNQRANANSSAVGGVLGAGNWYGNQMGWYGKK